MLKCTQEQLIKLLEITSARTIMVKDPQGRCARILDSALNARDIKTVATTFMQLLDSCKPNPLECRKIVVLDARGLPPKPVKPWKHIKSMIYYLTVFTKITVVIYTDDPMRGPRWLSLDNICVLCK